MKCHARMRLVVLVIALLPITISSLGAQHAGADDDVIWFNGYNGWELRVREDRFILTDHRAEATFRGTYEQVGRVATVVLDPRTTFFLEGPWRTSAKLEHIQTLVDSDELPTFFGTPPCADPDGAPFALEVIWREPYLDLSFQCNGQPIDSFRLRRVILDES